MKTLNKLVEAAPSIHERYQAFQQSLFEEGPLSERERKLVTLAAAMALNNPILLRTFVVEAKQAGLENEEIGHVSALVDLLRIEAQHASDEVPVKRARTCC